MDGDALRTTSTHYDLDALLAPNDRRMPEPHCLRTTMRQPSADPPAASPESVEMVSSYRIGRLLGEGGQGRVFAGEHGFLGREVAIKICSTSDGRISTRFAGEARLTASLSHPAIIPVYDAGDGRLVMKRLSGRSLDQVIADPRRPAGLPAMIEVLIDVCQAVEYAHDRGVLHRDLKAANILTGGFGEVTLIDWGLAVPLEDDHLPRTFEGLPVSICAGTPACMPPEVFSGRHDAVGRPADAFLLGCLIYHMLTGRMPYQETESVMDTLEYARDLRFAPVETINPQAPNRLVLLQQQCMERDPDRRLSVSALRDGLQQWLRQSGNLDQATQSLDLARLLVQRARLCGRREHEVRTDCFIQALVQFDRAIALTEDLPGITAEREAVLKDFIRASVQGGDITLARLLERHQRIPVSAVGSKSGLLNRIESADTTTRRHRLRKRG